LNKQYSSLDALYVDLETEMIKNLRKIATEIKSVLQRYIKTEIYDKGQAVTDWYTRTYELLNCLETSEVKKVGKGQYEVYVYFDTSKIHPFERRGMYDYDGFNAHMSLNGDREYEGRTISDWLVQWWEYGNDNPIWDMEGVGMVQKTVDWVKDDRYHLNRMCELLRDKNLNAIVM
jgi:hypothetical protein